MKKQELRDRKDIRKTLRQAFGKAWKVLSEDEKEKAVKLFYQRLEPEQVSAREAIRRSYKENINFGLFFLAGLFGIVTSLFAGALDEVVTSYGFTDPNLKLIPYAALTIIVLFLLNNLFEGLVNQRLRDYNVLNALLNDDERVDRR